MLTPFDNHVNWNGYLKVVPTSIGLTQIPPTLYNCYVLGRGAEAISRQAAVPSGFGGLLKGVVGRGLRRNRADGCVGAVGGQA